MKDPYRESTSPGAVGPFYRAPFYQRHRRTILRGSAYAIWGAIDLFIWYWAFRAIKADCTGVVLMTVGHVIGAAVFGIYLFNEASKDP